MASSDCRSALQNATTFCSHHISDSGLLIFHLLGIGWLLAQSEQIGIHLIFGIETLLICICLFLFVELSSKLTQPIYLYLNFIGPPWASLSICKYFLFRDS